MNVQSHIQANRLTASGGFEVPYGKRGVKNPSTFLLRVSDTVQIHIEAVGQLSVKPFQEWKKIERGRRRATCI